MDHDYTLEELLGMLRMAVSFAACNGKMPNDWCKSHPTCIGCRTALIDAIERKAAKEWQRGYDEGYASADDWCAEHEDAMAEHGWYRALDADGKPIRLKETMEGVDKYDSLKTVAGRVTAIIFEDAIDPAESATVAIRVWDVAGKASHTAYLDPNASIYRHHRPPTVEDVLDEIVDRANSVGCAYASNDMSGNEMMDALKAIITEFAPRLRLKED